MNSYEKQYMEIVNKIMKEGYYDQNRTGIPTYKVPHQIMQFDLSKEFPILQSKRVAFKTAVKELLWIYKDQSNDVTKLQEQNVHIWDEWVDENNTIGKAYGYQVRKFNQIDKLIETLKTNPQDRRMIISLWNIEDLPEMELQPCCFQTIFDVTDGKLNCMLIQRSGDWQIGIPFNTTQYAVLVHLIAQVTNLKPGILTHVVSNAHIYENQLEGAKEQCRRYDLMKYVQEKLDLIKSLEKLNATDECHQELIDKINKELEEDEELKEIKEVLLSTPKLELNPEIKDFYDFTADDINIVDYKCLKTIKMPVAV